jgi:hypothetical protein
MLVHVPLSLRYTDDELIDQMLQLRQMRQTGRRGVCVCNFTDFDDDPRELHEIPEVKTFCQRLLNLGFIADLDVTTSIKELSPFKEWPLPGVLVGLGAFEIWGLAEGRIVALGKCEFSRADLEKFLSVLNGCNRKADALLRGKTNPERN